MTGLRGYALTVDGAYDVAKRELEHALKGDLKGHWSVTVQANWRVTFRFKDGDAYVVDYQDYH